MKKIDAAAQAIKEAGYAQMAKEFRTHPEYRERIAKIVSRDVTQRLGHSVGSRLEAALMAAAS